MIEVRVVDEAVVAVLECGLGVIDILPSGAGGGGVRLSAAGAVPCVHLLAQCGE